MLRPLPRDIGRRYLLRSLCGKCIAGGSGLPYARALEDYVNQLDRCYRFDRSSRNLCPESVAPSSCSGWIRVPE